MKSHFWFKKLWNYTSFLSFLLNIVWELHPKMLFCFFFHYFCLKNFCKKSEKSRKRRFQPAFEVHITQMLVKICNIWTYFDKSIKIRLKSIFLNILNLSGSKKKMQKVFIFPPIIEKRCIENQCLSYVILLSCFQ